MPFERHHPPAFCHQHGLFPATAFQFGESVENIGVLDCAVECPQCGAVCEVISGVYSVTVKNQLNVILDSSVSPDALQALLDLVRRVETGNLSPQEADKQAAKISPELRGFFSRIDWSNTTATIVGAVLASIIASRFAPQPRPTP